MKTNRTGVWVNENQGDSWASKWRPKGLECESMKTKEITGRGTINLIAFQWLTLESHWFSFTRPGVSLLFIDSPWSPVGLHLLAQESPWFSLTHTAVLLVFIYSPRNLLGFHWLTQNENQGDSWESKWRPTGVECESMKTKEIPGRVNEDYEDCSVSQWKPRRFLGE
jgi:hypothetical protein